MLVAILVLSILTFCNSIVLGLILLSIYGKCEDIIEKTMTFKACFSEFLNGFANGMSNKHPKH